MGLDGKKAGQEQFTDVFCSLDAEYFDLRERNSAFGKQNGTTKHPETSNRIFTFTVKYELDPGNERKKSHFLPSRLPALCDGQQKRQNFMVLGFTGLESFLGKGQM